MIIHLDGDAFFAAVEIAKDHHLRGKPVVVGQERGIATAMSYEAKRMGITRGMPIFEVRKRFPQVIIRHSDFESYGSFSKRAIHIVRSYIARVEEYSIDECFGEFPPYEREYEKIGQAIKKDIQKMLGVTFSVGIAQTKVLAKVASKRNKPNGFTMLWPELVSEYLRKVPIGGVWGIGPQTSQAIQRQGVNTALEFSLMKEERVKELFSRPIVEIWHELNGVSIFSVRSSSEIEPRKSIQDTRSFGPATSNKKILLAELSHHTEEVCESARKDGLVGNGISFFLKSKSGQYFRTEFILPQPTSLPQEIIPHIFKRIDAIYSPYFIYKATGVTLSNLKRGLGKQDDLFGESKKKKSIQKVYDAVDRVNRKHGLQGVSLASSLSRVTGKSEGHHEKFPLPFLGEVS